MAKHKKGKEIDEGKERESSLSLLSQETKNSIFAVLLFLGAVLLLLSLFERAGVAGTYLAKGVGFLFGSASLLSPLLLLLAGISFLARIEKSGGAPVLLGLLALLVSAMGAFELLMGESEGAGYIGYLIAWPVRAFLSQSAGLTLFATLFLVGILVMFDVSLKKLFTLLTRAFKEEEGEAPAPLPGADWQVTPLEGVGKKHAPPTGGASREEEKEEKEERSEGEERKDDAYQPPPLSLLEADGSAPSSGDIQANKNIIQRTLEEFSIEAEMGQVSVGPTVTQYTLKPSHGVNLSRITALSRNLSLALAAHPIRIEAPIPGKSLVGIEIPNKQSAMVRLRSLIASVIDKRLPSTLALTLGRDVTGDPVITFLDKMPHLLISGSTGAGKSICLNAIITTLLYLNSPRNLRFILIDPKRVEFSIYEGIPHLLAPVIVDSKKAISALKWAIAEMERRYELLESANVRDIKGYNELRRKKKDIASLPYLVVIIDEMADLMMKYKREVEAGIVRIAQMARAVGIHLITSTQRPSTDVVTGLIKANITARVAFKMPTQIDSRTILDQAGAEKLLGYGDMLFMSGQAHGLKRIQGTF
ncbi:MAG: DNA translocase FtsK 4TM domain-containing protein, partial [Candidatus Portnoybacteria bacterium]|nr:DNA translocase FtsK 4TM domain-containing protein [Candidatus Portnoybacteria bacterium]